MGEMNIKKISLATHKFRKPELIKYGRPIIEPKDNWWECWQTFNTGAILLDEKIHFLYRAVGVDCISRFGYAISEDGFNLNERLDYPVYEHPIIPTSCPYGSGGSLGGAEDPRIVRVKGEDKLYVTYNLFSNEGIRVCLTSINVKDFLNRRWNWSKGVPISPPREVHKNWVIFPEKIGGKYALLHSLTPRVSIEYLDSLNFDGREFIKSQYVRADYPLDWEAVIKGVGPSPLKTDYGWIVFYHGLPKSNPELYCIGVMLLDLEEPTKIVAKAKKPVIIPEGLKGVKPNVVYTNGAVIKEDYIIVYYGAADTCVHVAYAKLEEFVENLITYNKEF